MITNKKERPTPESRIMRAVRLAERDAHELRRQKINGPVADVGTGQTILKMSQNPLVRLARSKTIGHLEIEAAAQIELAVSSISGGRPPSWLTERVDCGRARS